ncbi:MAG: BMP family ABC transporter substrate-binding protein [Acidimicrobiia bacterium]|nr:MAG: BMP family ABC transporter substrate-binding protein [Acidimicrobiia bacterium]
MTGFKRRGALVVLLLAFALVAAACSSTDDTTTTTAAAQTTTTAAAATTTTGAAAETTTTEGEMAVEPVLTCLVTDLAGVDDRSFNASAWAGVQAAMEAGFATEDSTFLESDAEEDWQANIDVFVAQGCKHIVTVGFFLGGVTAINAQANPDIKWTMIDNVLTDENFVPLNLTNVRENVYQTDEAAFAAGYLAAGVTKTDTLGVYGGANIPTVSIFLDGFTRGVAYFNEVKGRDVQVLGWDVEAQDGVFTGSFTDMVLARETADSLFQEGVDIILPVGGAINLPAGDAIIAGGLDAALIGVDVDAVLAMDAQYADLWLTTVEKNIKDLVTLSIQEDAEGTWAAGSFKGTLANGGVGLAPFHAWDDRVPGQLKAEVLMLLEDIKTGKIEAAFTKVGA